jgi:type IV pilus assembly protein PilA
MLARIRKAQENNEGGFTLIELLVVMIIIGILAAIAIPAFLNQKNKAKETSAKADVSTIGKEIAAYYVDGTGALTLTSTAGTWTLTDAAANTITGDLSTGNLTTATDATAHKIVSGDSFCVAVANGTTSPWKFSADNGLAKGACVAGDL